MAERFTFENWVTLLRWVFVVLVVLGVVAALAYDVRCAPGGRG